MIYYKKQKTDGTLEVIGTQDTLPTGAIEISESEYIELYHLIQETAFADAAEG